jgi:hypothetical protein
MMAVLAGLIMTIIILVLFQRPLPALPISIAFGILFFLVSALVLGPFIEWLTVLPPKALATLDSGLWVGKNGGATTYFI